MDNVGPSICDGGDIGDWNRFPERDFPADDFGEEGEEIEEGDWEYGVEDDF